MADGQEEDFSQLPLIDRFTHKVWKVRKEAYEAATKEFEITPSESDPAFRPFLQDAAIWKGVAGDSNVAAQQEGLAALCAFLKYGGHQAATRSRSFTLQPIIEKGLPSTRPAIKASALEALLLYVEIDKSDSVIEELLSALSHKQPKVVAATLSALTAIFHNYGIKIVEPKPVLKVLPTVFGHADKNVRAEASSLTVELYRWLREAMKAIFWSDLKPVQQQDLEKLFEKVKEGPAAKQERLTRSQQAAASKPSAANSIDHGADGGEGETEEEAPVEVDVFDLAEPVDVASKIPNDFNDMVASTKWKERKDALDGLLGVLNTPRIKEGPFDEIVRAFVKCMKDANVAVATSAANCIEKLAQGLRKGFSKYRSQVMSPLMERFKEKKQSVADAIGAALDATFASTSLSDCLEETLGFLTNKNPNVKGETVKFLLRCLKTTRDVPTKPEQKAIADSGTKLLTESTEVMRASGAEVLGVLMKIIGERAMGQYLDGLDEIRKTKIKEFYETAEVKAKEKPKPVAAAAKAGSTSAVGKKVVGGSKRPVSQKPISVGKVPIEETAPPISKPTAKPLTRPGSVQRPGLAQTSSMKLSGLKKPSGTGAVAAPSPQRRVISPQMSTSGDEEVAVSSPSKFGMGRGGLAGRPLSRPTVAPMSPPPVAPAAGGLSAIEKAELEELRAEKQRLTVLNDSLRSSNAKLTAEISELQNQNAQLIEDHTRDVLQIKAKETQLVRARGECDVLRGEVDSVRKDGERYKREVSRLGRESLGREREDMIRGRQTEEMTGLGVENGIYEDPGVRYSQAQFGPASSALHRTDSGASASGSRPTSAKLRPQSGFVGSSMNPSEEKENNGFDPYAARRKISPPMNGVAMGSGRDSPQRPTVGREPSNMSDGGGGGKEPAENWKRAAEVTSQLKARIEAMKARQGLNRP